MNIQEMTNQATNLARTGQFVELESVCKKILKKKPKHFSALHLLSCAQNGKGQLDRAITTLKKLCKLDQKHAMVRVDMANVYLLLGEMEKAILCSQEAIAIDPDQFAAHLALGNAQLFKKRYYDAERSYEIAYRLNPTSADIVDNQAECLKKQGKLQEALALHLKANEMNPNLSLVYVHLFQTLMFVGKRDDAFNVANLGLQVDSIEFSHQLNLWIGIARYGWLSGNVSLTVEALKNSYEIYQAYNDKTNEKHSRYIKAYHIYLTRLLALAESESESDYYITPHTNALYFIGDSHCFSPANIVVKFGGEYCKIFSSLIVGCKSWHLSVAEMNEHKASLKEMMLLTPEDARIVLGFGEIDCRADEGILIAYKNKSIDYKLSIKNMVKSYLGYAKGLANLRNQTLIIYGVPAPSSDALLKLDSDTQELLIDIVKLYNHALMMEASLNKFQYLDVYKATALDDGRSNMKYHIDGVHLHPNVYPVLFDTYLV